ncbi:site-2 protease family protein [Xylanibacillus composti]|uniref:Zinc metalloprotease n=1 Tax=Xylanibacillus composti TaxID=1572762 RepID=A0A8J4M2C1_9BACL|nr:site-2 protease family protein [Xylanibacillus composti]MDT9724443.1 site-2 protease family protein [Xylanibacillus composti]GIQ69705.1 zinc metalloprotease [Xylanibacillus composti]
MEGLQSRMAFIAEYWPFLLLSIIIAFTVHEFAHAYAAYRFGDDTPRKQGRLTLNPMAHLDWLGMLLIFIAGFGWAKPVMVNAGNFAKPRQMNIVVALVGPLSNLLLAVLGAAMHTAVLGSAWSAGWSAGTIYAFESFFILFVSLNILLFFFNLIPLPPLDGYRIVIEMLPLQVSHRLRQFEHWSFLIFLLIIFIPPLRAVTIDPLFGWITKLHTALLLFWSGIF